jgi:bla regulator protein BlaR1
MMNAKRSSNVKLTRYAFLVPAVVALLLVFSISKAALIKKSATAYKAFASTTKTGIATISKNIVSLAKNNSAATAVTLKTAATLPISTKGDTIRKGGFFLSSPHPTDSLNYVINGSKATKADFKALNNDHIYSIEMMAGDEASKIIDKIDTRYSVLFVTTDDSEAGKRFKHKIDSTNGNGTVNANVIVTGRGSIVAGSSGGVAVTGSTSSGEGVSTAVTVNSDNTSAPTVVYTIAAPKHKAMKLKTMPGHHMMYMADSVITFNDNEPATVQINGKDTLRTFAPFASYTIASNNKVWTAKPKIAGKIFKYNRAASSKPFTIYSSNLNEESNIEHLSSKMIMIDGKEANEQALKKLSAADIESMSVKSGEEITEKYGEKAKNGVVFITTKKGEK